ncbi:hypothetical protein LguiA_026497 [Lonicera macranthoides]
MDAAVVRANKGSSFRGYKHDVYISSSDPDDEALTRSISEALVNAGSRVYRKKDDQGYTQQKSNNAIQRSKIALVFFTKNYVSSTQCLDELVRILNSKKIFGYQFFPLLFDVDLSEVVDQKFAWVQNDVKSKIQGWKKALREALEYAGLVRKHADDLNIAINPLNFEKTYTGSINLPLPGHYHKYKAGSGESIRQNRSRYWWIYSQVEDCLVGKAVATLKFGLPPNCQLFSSLSKSKPKCKMSYYQMWTNIRLIGGSTNHSWED